MGQEILITTLCLKSLKKPEVNLRPGLKDNIIDVEIKTPGHTNQSVRLKVSVPKSSMTPTSQLGDTIKGHTHHHSMINYEDLNEIIALNLGTISRTITFLDQLEPDDDQNISGPKIIVSKTHNLESLSFKNP